MIKFIFLYIFRLMFITCVSGSKTVLCWLMHTLSCSCTSLYLTCILFSFLPSWIDSSKQVFFNIKSKSSVYGNNVSTACYYLDYSASNNNWFIPLFTPLHVIKHCPYWSLLILMFKHFFCFISAQDDVLWRGSGLRIRFKVVESEVVWELILCMYNITHMFHPSLPPPPFSRPDCSGSGSGLRIKFKVVECEVVWELTIT